MDNGKRDKYYIEYHLAPPEIIRRRILTWSNVETVIFILIFIR